MPSFQIEIRYPNHFQLDEVEVYENVDAGGVASMFDSINWRNQLLLQLQMESHDSTFRVIDQNTGQHLALSLKTYSAEQDMCFKLDSDITVFCSHQSLFGLIRLNTKKYVSFQSLNLVQVRENLSQFLVQDFDAIRKSYHDRLKNKQS